MPPGQGLYKLHLSWHIPARSLLPNLRTQKLFNEVFMKKMTPVSILLASAFTLSNSAMALEMPQDPSTVTLDQAVAVANSQDSELHKIQSKIEAMCSPDLNAPDQDREIKNAAFKARYEKQYDNKNNDSNFEKEISRYKITLSLGDLGGLINTHFLFGGADYRYVVQPAFRDNQQLRQDVWEFQVGLKTPNTVVAKAYTTIRMTFSRFFGGPNAKWNAMKACPYFVTQTPMNTNDVKTKLRDGDGFRFEVLGTTSLGIDKETKTSLYGTWNASVKAEALFLMDLYKINNQMARARLMGVKNKGEVSVGFTARTNSFWDVIKGKLRDVLTLGLSAAFRSSLTLFGLLDKFPLDTMMVDYLYHFSTDKIVDLPSLKGREDIAEAAMEELFTNIRKVGFASLFFSSGELSHLKSNDPDLGSRLLQKIHITEKIAREDFDLYRQGKISAKDMRIRNFFKGRMQSDLFSSEGQGWLSALLSAKGQIGALDSYVTSYDEYMQAHYYFLNNSFERTLLDRVFGRDHYNARHDFDLLVNSDKGLNVGSISDIVSQTEIEDTVLSEKQLRQIKEDLRISLPPDYKNDSQFDAFFPATEQTNAYLSHRYVFGEEAFKAIARFSPPELGQLLYEFIDNHPEKRLMNLPVDTPDQPGGVGTYAYERATQLLHMIDPHTKNEESLSDFKLMKRENIFEKYIVGEFFPSLLPVGQSKDMFGLTLKLTSRESGTPAPVEVGNRKVSPVYEAVSFLKSVITDPSFDMQMVSSTDNTGGFVPATGATSLPPQTVATPPGVTLTVPAP
jgi:hypothetical protein